MKMIPWHFLEILPGVQVRTWNFILHTRCEVDVWTFKNLVKRQCAIYRPEHTFWKSRVTKLTKSSTNFIYQRVSAKSVFEKVRGHSCPCTYHVPKSSLTYTKKRECELWNSFNFQNHWRIFYRNILLLTYWNLFGSSFVVLLRHRSVFTFRHFRV